MCSCLRRCRVSLISRSLAEFVYIRLASANSDFNPSSFNSKSQPSNMLLLFLVPTSRNLLSSSCKIATTIPLIPPSELHLVPLRKYTRPSGGVGGVKICVKRPSVIGFSFTHVGRDDGPARSSDREASGLRRDQRPVVKKKSGCQHSECGGKKNNPICHFQPQAVRLDEWK